jgi:hypothetical protein
MAITSPRVGQAGHFRNVKFGNVKSNANIVDLGGGPRNRKIQNGVAYYFHGYPTPEQTTKVVSTKNPEMLKDAEYQPVKDFTGKDVRAAVVKDVEFPTLLNPVDDLPPASLIRAITKSGGKLIVTGVSQDNGDIVGVSVNGQPAKIAASAAGVTEWRAEIPAADKVTATATDRAGNVEKWVHATVSR